MECKITCMYLRMSKARYGPSLKCASRDTGRPGFRSLIILIRYLVSLCSPHRAQITDLLLPFVAAITRWDSILEPLTLAIKNKTRRAHLPFPALVKAEHGRNCRNFQTILSGRGYLPKEIADLTQAHPLARLSIVSDAH